MRAQVAAQNDNSHFEYILDELEKKDIATYRVIESDAGSVQRKIAINRAPLTAGQREHEKQQLAKLLADPSIQRARQKDDAEETTHRQKIISALGQAFLYDIEGTEADGEIVRIHFRPNPSFHPDSREAKVCAGLEGTMWVDQRKQRFTRARGTLIRDVDFGWGFLGHLDKGGQFAIEQTEVDPGLWRITDLDVSFKARLLLFKSLNIRVQEHSSQFHRLPEHLSLHDAIDMLRQEGASSPPVK